MKLFGRQPKETETPDVRAYRIELIRNLTFEILPLKTAPAAIAALPEGAEVSVTCSPRMGIDESLRVSGELRSRGFRPIPHIAARQVRDRSHVKRISRWLRDDAIESIFVVAGDTPTPGRYPGSIQFLDELLDTDHSLGAIGIAAYPDGHPFLERGQLDEALLQKQEVIHRAGIRSWCSTQMCFNTTTIANWTTATRASGLTMPIHLGLPGVVDRARLLAMGSRLGIGDSLSYLKKNRTALTKLLAARAYNPNQLLIPLSATLRNNHVTGLHVFTFNQVHATEMWRRAS